MNVVSGQSRFKYFERPIISQEEQDQQLPDPNIILAPVPKSSIISEQQKDKVYIKTVAIQTGNNFTTIFTKPI